MSEQLKGHGHVTPNADGFLARCGGPSICKVCKAELAALKAQEPVGYQLPPFAQKVIRKLERFQECTDDGQGADIGRHWFDLLTQLGLLNRVQRSPALWEITQQGEDLLAAAKATSAADGWIPVGERMPEPGEPVQVWCEGAEQPGLAWVSRHADWSGEWVIPEPQAIGYESITHWMPLPSGPAAHRARGLV